MTTKNTGADLFTRVRIGDLDLPNRIVMAPMTRNRAAPGNIPQAMNITYYTQRASAGLIITEGAQVSPQGVGYPATPGIHSQEQIAGWRKVTDAVHAKGGRIFLQLWHVGRISHPSLQPDNALPVAPSAIKPEGEVHTYEGPKPFVAPRALATDEIAGVVAQFAQGAVNSKAAGFDGVEIHGANGYIIDQFLRDGTNRRNDRYGGSLENRARFLLEVTQAVADAFGAARVGVRLSPVSSFNSMKDSDPATTFNYAAKALSRFGLAYLHIVEMADPGVQFDFRRLRRSFSGCYMANAGYTLERASAAIKNGDADLVSFAKLYLANPDLPERFRKGAALNTPDTATFYGGGEKGYIDYPFLAS